MAAAQVQMGQLLEKRSTPSAVQVGDKVWLDSGHTPVDIPCKLTARWFGPLEVLESRGAQVTLDLPKTFGKANHNVNIRWLKFFEEHIAFLVGLDLTRLWSQRMVMRAMRSSVSPTHEHTRDRQNCGTSGKVTISRKIARYFETY